MEIIYFWMSGLLTGVATMIAFIKQSKYKKQLTINNKILDVNKKLNSKLEDLSFKLTSKTTKERFADYMWQGWYPTAKPTEKYAVIFHLKQIAKSEEKPNLFKFEVVSVLSQQKNDAWGLKEYSDYFYKNYGGWLDVSKLGKDFNWIVTQTKQEIRDDKINEILASDE